MFLATALVVLTAIAPGPAPGGPPPAPSLVEAGLGRAEVGPARPDSSLAARLARAFETADVRALLMEAASRVDVTVEGEGTRYSRAQAAFVLQAFFRDHPPVRATLATAGVADGARSLLGHYEADDGGRHRLDVRLRRRGQTWEVSGIRIEPLRGASGS